MCSSRRKTTILRCSRATRHTYIDFFDDRLLRFPHTIAQPHSHANFVRCIFIHGRIIVERSSVFRSHYDHFHARQISTRLNVLETSTSHFAWNVFINRFLMTASSFVAFVGPIETCSLVYTDPICVSCGFVVYQVIFLYIDSVSVDVSRNDCNSKVFGMLIYTS